MSAADLRGYNPSVRFEREKCKKATKWDENHHRTQEVLEYFERAFGKQKLAQISEALCRPSLRTSLRVNSTKTTPQEVIVKLKEDPSFANVNLFPDPVVPGVVIIEGTGPRKIDYSEKGLKELVVTRKAGEAILRGADVFIPGVLACSSGLTQGDRVAVSIALELPDSSWNGICRGTILRGDENPGDSLDRTNLYLGTGRTEVSRVELFRKREGVAVKLEEPVFSIPSCSGLLQGEIMLQNLPSIVAAHIMDPKPGWRVLDMCAAPGGKTTAIAELMEDNGEVIALDRTHKKACQVIDYAQQLGLTCVKAYKMDATKAAGVKEKQGGGKSEGIDDSVENPKLAARKKRIEAARKVRKQDAPREAKRTESGPGFELESFDGVLLDAPCTALGLRPRLLHRHTLSELQSTGQYQRRLMKAAVKLVKPGGVLVFSTCTINPGENEENVKHLLDEYPFMALECPGVKIGGPGLTGLFSNDEQWLTDMQASMVQRFDPCAELDTIGFFIAKFRKTSSAMEYLQKDAL